MPNPGQILSKLLAMETYQGSNLGSHCWFALAIARREFATAM
jgi:hypothetical protein